MFAQIVEPMDTTNAAIVRMLEVDSRKLCETTEGLIGGGLVLKHVQQVVENMAEKCKHQDVPQDTHTEDPVPEMTVVDDRDEPTASEPEHQEEDTTAPLQ